MCIKVMFGYISVSGNACDALCIQSEHWQKLPAGHVSKRRNHARYRYAHQAVATRVASVDPGKEGNVAHVV